MIKTATTVKNPMLNEIMRLISGHQASEHNLLQIILDEVRTLRDEMRLLIPEESLEEYAHPEEIRKALHNTLKEWKTGAITDTRKVFARLPVSIKKLYQRQENLFRADWRDARLHIKKLKGQALTFSFRITRRYRVLFILVDANTALFATIDHRKDAYR